MEAEKTVDQGKQLEREEKRQSTVGDVDLSLYTDGSAEGGVASGVLVW